MAQKLKLIMILMLAIGLLGAPRVNAQLTVLNSNVPPGFGQAGYIEAATCDLSCGATSGGTLTMNGTTMIVPENSVVQFPANTQTWSALFDPTVSAPVPVNHPAPTIAAGRTGLALTDNPAQTAGTSPYLPFNAIVQGNIDVKGTTINNVTKLPNPPGTYIVGLILPINQDIGNGGQGFVTFIDYTKSRFEVGGTLNQQGTGTVIEINDPTGRYGLAHSPDPRWSVDNENPTIATGNGYPMCVPRVAPPTIDPDCPTFNRPLNPPLGALHHDPLFQPGAPLQTFIMPPSKAPGTTKPDPWKQVPLMVGDYIAYAGVLYKNVPNATTITDFKSQTYVSANTVSVDKLAAYTAQGTADKVGPAYVQLARMVIGTGGNINGVNVLPNSNLGIQGGNIILPEPRNNIVIRGFVTDSTQLVDIVAIDIDPTSGDETCRILGTLLPEPGIFQGVIARGNKGRFTFEVGKGSFQPVTRVYAAYSHHGQVLLPDQTNGGTTPQPPPTPTPNSTPRLCVDNSVPISPDLSKGGSLKNGLYTGQYHAPMFTFQFPDAPPGFPNIPNNFGDVRFLTQGEGTVNPNPSAGPLIPQPPICPNVTSGGVTTPTCQP